MWKAILQTVKATFPVIAGCLISTFFTYQAYSQQWVIADKNNTRPEVKRQVSSAALLSSVNVKKFNGYNEVNWSALNEQDTRKFIVEYSFDGIDFMSAGEALSSNGFYNLKHYTLDMRPVLYRIRIEELNGKFSNSSIILLDGIDVPVVKVYPTIIKGNSINADAAFPVERIAVVSTDGRQVFAQDLNGVRDFIPLTIPALEKGMYFITFYGNGWKTTSKFMVS
jgi:hypothetical protein